MASDVIKLRERIYESDLYDWRNFRIQSTQNWKNRLKVVDTLYRGEWKEVFPDESIMNENPHVMNMVQVGLDDIAKLVSEAVPSVRCITSKDTQDGEKETIIRNSIADTYWQVNDGETLVPRLAMDIAGAGMAIAVGYIDPGSEYPCVQRIDPRFAYPDVVNGKLINLLVVEEMNVRSAAALFPDLGLDKDPTITSQKVELLHYFSKDECVQAVVSNAGQPGTNTTIVKRWYPGQLTVAFVQLDSFDGQFRGMFDQITGSLQTKNRIVKQLLDYTDQLVYAPIEEQGVLNPEVLDTLGPSTIIRLDPSNVNAKVGRMNPAGSSPEIFSILEYLDKEQRGSASYPSARQGEISQSIASASFVASTQGQLTSTVRNIQRLLASLRQQLNTILFKLDEDFLNKDKALYTPVGTKKTYKPKTAISGNYKNMVLYGAGAGLDRLNADVRILQLLGANIISREDAREQIDFIKNPDGVSKRVDLEQTQSALMQKFLGEAPVEMLVKVLALQAGGLSLNEAVLIVSQEAAQQQPPAGAPPAPGAPGEVPGAPAGPGMPMPGEAPAPDAATQAQALQSGGQVTPSGFNPPPLENIVVH